MLSSRLTVERGGGGVASLVVHRSDEAPLVRLGRVSLRRVLTYVSVVASHRVDAAVQHRHAHVTPRHTIRYDAVRSSWKSQPARLEVLSRRIRRRSAPYGTASGDACAVRRWIRR